MSQKTQYNRATRCLQAMIDSCEISQVLKNKRLECGMSLKDAHAATSISTNTLRSIEDGSTKPTLDEFFALAKTYRCSGDCILASAIRLSCSIDEIVDMGKHMISAN